MKVKVRVVGDFTKYPYPHWEWINVDTEPGITLQQFLEQVGIARGEVGPATVNDALADMGTILREGDSVQAFSPVGGGSQR
ncbi:MAG TPA: MoaD/ThiS family protein [Chloroflexota bacterium]|nr:MoaD/ThiS family protein [Chloroflexota bacterium]